MKLAVSPFTVSLVITAVAAAALTACAGSGSGPTIPSPPESDASLTIVDGDRQVESPGLPLTNPIQVRVRTASDQPAAGETVTFVVSSGGGSVSPIAAVTDNLGRASTTWTLGPNAGPNSLVVSVDTLTPAIATATAVNLEMASVSAGTTHTCATTASNVVLCWGEGALGTGELGNSFKPVILPDWHTYVSVAAGDHFTCGLAASGKVACWGRNSSGQLGPNGTTGVDSPTLPSTYDRPIVTLTTGSNYACGLAQDGAIVCWGANDNGQLGARPRGTALTPNVVVPDGYLQFVAVSAGGVHTCGIATDGETYCWGNGNNGELGTPTLLHGDYFGPAVGHPVAGGHRFTSLTSGSYHVCGLAQDRSAWCWGDDDFGQLGNGPDGEAEHDSPVAVTGGLAFEQLTAGENYTCGLVQPGRAYCWGWNRAGNLGEGTLTNRLAPTEVLGGLLFTHLDAGREHVCGIATNGGTYCWGGNEKGQLGDGTQTSYLQPRPVRHP